MGDPFLALIITGTPYTVSLGYRYNSKDQSFRSLELSKKQKSSLWRTSFQPGPLRGPVGPIGPDFCYEIPCKVTED
jgi:hypothetical protein